MAAVLNAPGNIGESLPDAIRGDRDEFETLFLEHYPQVVRLLIRLTGDRAQAEELSNEVFWRLSRQPAHWLLTKNVAPWLYRTAMNAGIDSLRAATKRARYEQTAFRDDSQARSPEGPLDDLLLRESRLRVRDALGAMKSARARLLLLRSCGASYKDLSEFLGVSVGSIGTLLNRAEAEFRKKYLALIAKEKAS